MTTKTFTEIEQAIINTVGQYGGKVRIERLEQAVMLEGYSEGDFYAFLDSLCDCRVLAEYTKGIISFY